MSKFLLSDDRKAELEAKFRRQAQQKTARIDARSTALNENLKAIQRNESVGMRGKLQAALRLKGGK